MSINFNKVELKLNVNLIEKLKCFDNLKFRHFYPKYTKEYSNNKNCSTINHNNPINGSFRVISLKNIARCSKTLLLFCSLYNVLLSLICTLY